MTKYQVLIGKEFDVEVEVDEEDKDPKGHEEQKERMRIVSIVFGASMTFLGGAALLGVIDSDFSALNAVWSVASVPVSSILTFYFTRA